MTTHFYKILPVDLTLIKDQLVLHSHYWLSNYNIEEQRTKRQCKGVVSVHCICDQKTFPTICNVVCGIQFITR